MICMAPALADSAATYWSPWVTMTSTTSAIINWHGGSSESGVVEYATSDYYTQYGKFDHSVSSGATSMYQHVLLEGLAPDTLYVYQVEPSGNTHAFGVRSFATMPLNGPFTFIVISDSQEGHNYTEWMRFKYVADAIANESDIQFILHGGDYAGHDSEDLWATYFAVADGMLSKNVLFTNIGNHEYHNSGGDTPTDAVQYHGAYNVPLNYSFDCANVRFIVLDSPDPNNANGDDPHPSLALSEEQAPWLEEQLNTPVQGVFTIHHHPIWDGASTTPSPELLPWETLYHKYNISANFAGHTHNYQRYSVEGIPYFIVGDAGGNCSDFNQSWPSGYYQFGRTRILGYLKVSIDPASNLATAQEIVVATVKEDDDNETPTVLNQPLVLDSVTFPLSTNPPEPELSADFTITPVSGTVPLTVACTDRSTGSPTRYAYDFGDGTGASGPNPSHTYRVPGVYTVTLTITKFDSAKSKVKTSTIKKIRAVTVNPAPSIPLVANFSISPEHGKAPLRVTCTDHSTGGAISYTYDFGDGGYSVGKSGVHTYQVPGRYNITETILKKDPATGSVVTDVCIRNILVEG